MAFRQDGDRLALAEKILLETVSLTKRNELDFKKWKEEQAKRQAEQADEQAKRQAEQAEEQAKRQAEREAWQKAQADEQAKRQAEHEVWRKEQEKFQAKRDKQMGELSNKLGTLVEDFVIPNMEELFHELVPSVDIDDIVTYARVKRVHRPTMQQLEIDAMAEGGNVVLVNETKSTMKVDYVDNFLGVLAIFRRFFGEYQEFKVLGMISSLYIDPSIVKYAARQGLLVAALKPGLLQVMNETDFVPKEF